MNKSIGNNTSTQKYSSDYLWILEKHEVKCSGNLFQNTIQQSWIQHKILFLQQMVIFLILITHNAISITTARIKVLKR
jgi:hypothetical protein